VVLGSSRLQYCYYDWCILKCIFVWNCSSYAETRVRPFGTWLLLPLLGSRSCRCQTQWRCLFGFVCVTPAYCCIACRAMCPLCVYVWATEWPEPTHLWTLLYVYICVWWYDAHVRPLYMQSGHRRVWCAQLGRWNWRTVISRSGIMLFCWSRHLYASPQVLSCLCAGMYQTLHCRSVSVWFWFAVKPK